MDVSNTDKSIKSVFFHLTKILGPHQLQEDVWLCQINESFKFIALGHFAKFGLFSFLSRSGLVKMHISFRTTEKLGAVEVLSSSKSFIKKWERIYEMGWALYITKQLYPMENHSL